jgi:hypothetical protein
MTSPIVRATKPTQLTWRNFDADDLRHCTAEELVYIISEIVVSAKSLMLADDELGLFWKVRAEMTRRKANIHAA